MVRVVEHRDATSAEEFVLEFKVYRSPKDGKTVLGYLRPRGFIVGKNTVHWVGTPFGVPVADAFCTAVRLCEGLGAPALWVYDPRGYFPPKSRPVTAPM